MRKNLTTAAGPLRSGCGLFTPPTCAPFDPLFFDVVAGLAQRLKFPKPEQGVVFPMWNHMVSNRRLLFRIIGAEPAQRLTRQLLFAPPTFAAPGFALIPFAAWLVGSLCVCGSVPVPLVLRRMGFAICRPKIDQPGTARMRTGLLRHCKSFDVTGLPEEIGNLIVDRGSAHEKTPRHFGRGLLDIRPRASTYLSQKISQALI